MAANMLPYREATHATFSSINGTLYFQRKKIEVPRKEIRQNIGTAKPF
jgi:hypothetical protein